MERKELNGVASFLFSGCRVTRLKQNSLLALAKSYVVRSKQASGPGL